MHKSERQSGFTLVELVVVMVILGILAAVAVPKFTDLSDEAETAACKGNQHAIEAAAAMYYAEQAVAGSPAFPADLSAMSSLFSAGTPECPGSGTFTYDKAVGSVSCSVTGHAR